jgi:phage replication O-like protein O
MANPQPDKFTLISNEIMDAFMRTNFSAQERRILDCILRNTYGWGRKVDRIAYSIFEKSTGIDHRHIGRSLKSLKERNIITVTGTGYMLEYGLQKDYEKWDLTPNGAPILHQTRHQIDTVSGTDLTPNGAPILKTDNKDLPPFQAPLTPNEAPILPPFGAHIKEITHLSKKYKDADYIFILPDWINKETWDAFIEMRKRIKKPATEYAKHLIELELQKLKDAGEDPQAVLEKSIRSSWQDVFTLKGKQGGTQNDTKSVPDPRKW